MDIYQSSFDVEDSRYQNLIFSKKACRDEKGCMPCNINKCEPLMSSLLMSVVALFTMSTSATLVCPYRLQLLYLAAAR